ncbi:hypothetical protein CHRYSEO8AT_620003 [Chryseobacterium sp. 8AT]|nr:hypothetical protein CHRYSEO8AT_620003 [Chryseobacterium sp. 8AT]
MISRKFKNINTLKSNSFLFDAYFRKNKIALNIRRKKWKNIQKQNIQNQSI